MYAILKKNKKTYNLFIKQILGLFIYFLKSKIYLILCYKCTKNMNNKELI